VYNHHYLTEPESVVLPLSSEYLPELNVLQQLLLPIQWDESFSFPTFHFRVYYDQFMDLASSVSRRGIGFNPEHYPTEIKMYVYSSIGDLPGLPFFGNSDSEYDSSDDPPLFYSDDNSTDSDGPPGLVSDDSSDNNSDTEDESDSDSWSHGACPNQKGG
jgi:hypothetical protein